MSSKRRIKRRRKGKRHYHIILILIFIAIGTFFFYKEFGKEDLKPERALKQVQPKKERGILPKVAIIIDDLGTSKKAAVSVFNINASLTLSILPHETYSAWIAGEGHRRGYDLIGHIPAEAKSSQNLGKGGLYTWMSDNEIRRTLEGDINSIPHIKGISNHMGSAFTEDERAMSVLMAVLKKHGLFFLDSLTTPHSVGYKLARTQRLKVLRRDIFLDNENNPDYIKAQWERAVRIAQKRSYVIVLAHPRKNTIEFLKEISSKNEIEVVPLSELVASR